MVALGMGRGEGLLLTALQSDMVLAAVWGVALQERRSAETERWMLSTGDGERLWRGF